MKKIKLFWKNRPIILSCIAGLLLCLAIFLFWYQHPRTYLGNITVEAEDGETLNIQLKLNARRNFFKPEEFWGSILIGGEEYISTFYVENEDIDAALQNYDPVSSHLEPVAYMVPYNHENWLENLKAKMQGEKWVPFFVLKGQENLKNIVVIENVSELFQQKSLEKCNLIIRKNEKNYIIRESARRNY